MESRLLCNYWPLIFLWVHLETGDVDLNFSGSEFMEGVCVVVLRLKTIWYSQLGHSREYIYIYTCFPMKKILGTNIVNWSLQLNLREIRVQSKVPLGRTAFSQLNNWGVLVLNQIDEKEDIALNIRYICLHIYLLS